MKTLCKCGYCGTEWVDETSPMGWRYPSRHCPHCGEVKDIVARELPEEGRDIYGYHKKKKD